MHDNIEVSVVNGIVTVANATNIEIYSIKGQCVYKGNSNHIEGLVSGIYVVCADTKIFKIKINN